MSDRPCTSTAPSALNLIKEAFQELENTVTLSDSRIFFSTTLEDVRNAALQIERQLAARQLLCNMRRLEPLLTGLDHYSKVIEVLCNGTPYLPWIWAPIKLILQVCIYLRLRRNFLSVLRPLTFLQLGSDCISAFRTIVDAYSHIAETLPRFDRLGNTFENDSDFQYVLAVFYSDILRFHKTAYKFVRRPGKFSARDD